MGCPSLLLTNVKGIKNANFGGFWLGDAYTRGSYIKSASTEGAYIAGTCNSTCSETICISGPSAIERLKIHLQFFQILEVKDTGLEIYIGNSWWLLYICSLCVY